MSSAVGLEASRHARGWRRGVLDQYGGACHVCPDAVPACCPVAELCADGVPYDPFTSGTEAQRLRFGRSALTQGPIPAAELSPAATTCAPSSCHASDCAILTQSLSRDEVRRGKNRLTQHVPAVGGRAGP